jgi:hypothetical protein
MATGSTLISALSPKDSSPQTMLLSAVPEGLRRLADLGNYPVPRLYFSFKELTEITYGQNIEKHEETLEDGTYLSNVLQCLQWWDEVATWLALGNSDKGEYGEAQFEKQRAKYLKLLNDVLSGYAAALAESPFYAGCGSSSRPAGLELMRRYRACVDEIMQFAGDVWPGVDFLWMLRES